MPRVGPAPAKAKAAARAAVDPLATGEELVLLLALFLVPLLTGTFPQYLVFLRGLAVVPPYLGEAVVFSLLAVAWALRVVRRFLGRAPSLLAVPLVAMPAVAFALWVGVSTIGSLAPVRGLVELSRVCAGLVLFLLVATQPPAARGRALTALLIGAGLAAVLGIQEYLVQWLREDNPSWRVFGPFYNPNEFAVFMAMAVFLALGAWRLRDARWWRLALGVGVLCALFDVLLSGSRSGFLALGAGVVVFLALAWPGRDRAWSRLGIGAVALAALVALALIVPPLHARLGSLLSDNSAIFRVYTWKSTAQMVVDTRLGLLRPVFGDGPGTFEVLFPQYAEAGFTRSAHQIFLQTAAETGLVGLAVLLWLLGAVARAGFRWWATGSRRERMVAAGVLAALTVLLAQGLVDYGWYITATHLTAWLCFALVAAPGEPPRADRWRGTAATGGVVLTLLVAYLLGLAPVSRAVAGWHYVQAERGAQVASFSLLLAHLREAMRWDPTDDSYPRLYAQTVLAFAIEGTPAQQRDARARVADAIESLAQVLQHDPYNADVRRLLAGLYEVSGDWRKAEDQYRRALKYNPQMYSAALTLADMLVSQQRFEDAAAVLRNLLRLRGTPVEQYPALAGDVIIEFGAAHYQLAVLALRGQTPDDPGENLERALAVVHAFSVASHAIIEPSQRQRKELSVQQLAARVRWRQAELRERAGTREHAQQLRAEARRLWRDVRLRIEQEDRLFDRQ